MPRRLAAALTAGGLSVVPIVATTAAAGIIVGVITLTGLGLKAASLIVTLAGASRILTTLYAALAVWALGLAVPVTACYIIAAVMVAPALTQVGISVEAAHMFVFYYAVLSEVSPPTALSPFAAAAITGGNPFRTTMLTWKYATPAFLVPFAFTWTPMGEALLLRGTATEIAVAAAMSALGVAAMAIGAAGYFLRPVTGVERVLAIAGSVMLLSIDRRLGAAGLGLLIVAAHPALPAAGARRNGLEDHARVDDQAARLVDHGVALEDATVISRRQRRQATFDGHRHRRHLLLPAWGQLARPGVLLLQAGRQVAVLRRVVLTNDCDVLRREHDVDLGPCAAAHVVRGVLMLVTPVAPALAVKCRPRHQLGGERHANACV